MLIVRNNSEFSVSIAANTNRVVSSSQSSFSGTRAGTYVKLGDDDILYSVSKVNQFYYPKNFEVIDNRTIKLNLNTEVNLQPNDVLKIIYEEYELTDILEIKNGGRLFSNDDILTILGGELSIDIREGFGHPTKLKVEETDDNGCIKKLSLLQAGKYIVPPKEFEFTSTNGVNADIQLKYSIIDSRAIINRVIKTLDFKEKETILGLDYSLPLGIKNGKISVEKWEIFLNMPYPKTEYNIKYVCFKDFTPELNIPLIPKGTPNFELLYNQAMIKLEKKIVELEKRIK